MDRAELELAKRATVAVEELTEIIRDIYRESKENLEHEPTPPKCPHCQDVNPAIIVEAHTHDGSILEYGIKAQCKKCHEVFYVIFNGWFICKTVRDAQLAGQLLIEEMTSDKRRES